MTLARRPLMLAAIGAAALALAVVALGRHAARPAATRLAAPTADTHGIRFEEIAASSGLHFRWNPHPHRPLNIMDGFGHGCAFLDYDGDGWQDILLVGEPTCALFHNDGQGRFRDVTHQAGLDQSRGAWKGVAVGDYDGDGRLDLFLSGYHALALLRNLGAGRFADVTRAAGLDTRNWGNWGASAGFMDLDGDGDLDLVLQNYVVWGPGVKQLCVYKGIQMACPPEVHDPERPRLLRNNGNGTFSDVSRNAGFDRLPGAGMVVAFVDADEDGRMDFWLGNDGRPANFMKNLGGLRFRDVALENGTAYGESDRPMAAMGVDWADYDRDGTLDFAVSAFSENSYALFRHEPGALFRHVSRAVGIATPTYLPLGFGTKFADVDNDGWPDLCFVNGHIIDRIEEATPGLHFREPPMLFHNEGGRHFTDLAPSLGGAWTRPMLGRGSAAGDIDNDGRIDFLAVDDEGGPLLLRNLSSTPGHWLTLVLRARGTNRFAFGARVRLEAGRESWIGQVSPASSYLSSSDPRLHFGLGNVPRVDRITIRWPSGSVQTVRNAPADRILTFIEGPDTRAGQSPVSARRH